MAKSIASYKDLAYQLQCRIDEVKDRIGILEDEQHHLEYHLDDVLVACKDKRIKLKHKS